MTDMSPILCIRVLYRLYMGILNNYANRQTKNYCCSMYSSRRNIMMHFKTTLNSYQLTSQKVS